MRYRPIGTDPDDPRLGRLIPDDWEHVEKYPLSALSISEAPAYVPVVIGVNWYREFDTPTRSSIFSDYWIARGGPQTLTRIRGGHCVCLEPSVSTDLYSWYTFYDQGSEGACVGFGWSRCMSILNRRMYASRWLWDRCKERDEWADTNPGDSNGTSVRAGGEVLTQMGHVAWRSEFGDDSVAERFSYVPEGVQGITRFRWARSVDEVHSVLRSPKADRLGAVPVLNSWGKSYPRRVWMPDTVLDRLLREDGEIAIPTDR